MILIKQGAESRIFLDPIKNILVKERFPKSYRIHELDLMINKKRLKCEIKGLEKCKLAGIKVPTVYKHDFQTMSLHMEYFENHITLKELFDKTTSTEQLNNLASLLGNKIGELHRAGIIHGDLTTSNFLIPQIYNPKNQLIAIDFGLSLYFDFSDPKVVKSSSVLEDMAVDLYVLERAFVSTHYKLEYLINEKILPSYAKTLDNVDSIIPPIHDLEADNNFSDSDESFIEETPKNSNLNTQSQAFLVLNKLNAVRLRGRKRSMVG